MILKPHEILNALGFDINEDGVEINDNDAYLHQKILKLVGATLDVNHIPENDLLKLHGDLAGLVAAWRKERPVSSNGQSAEKLRVLIRCILEQHYNIEEIHNGKNGTTSSGKED